MIDMNIILVTGFLLFSVWLYREIKFRYICRKTAAKYYPRYNCIACGKNLNISPKDHFTVTLLLKEYTGTDRNLRLCLKCFEKKLGRKLVFHDLLSCPLNNLLNPYTKRITWNHFKGIKKGKSLKWFDYLELIKPIEEAVAAKKVTTDDVKGDQL